MPPTRSKTVEEYLEQVPQWTDVLSKLRKILLATDLEETIKWGAPCYTLDGKNVVGLAGFKEHCALWFHQGVFLKDELGVLLNAQEGKTKALRHWRFESIKDVKVRAVKGYVLEAIENQRAGKVIKPDTKKALTIPTELKAALAKNKKLKAAFAKLTPGKQREFADHIGSAKREATRESRVEKAAPMILAGVGLNDKYRDC